MKLKKEDVGEERRERWNGKTESIVTREILFLRRGAVKSVR